MQPTVTLRPREERRLLDGHSWVFSNEIASLEGSPSAGSVVTVRRHDGRTIGVGFFHPHSLIAVRILDREPRPIDRAFFEERIRTALRKRERLFPDDSAYRIVHGESDGLPGLIVDRYGSNLVLQAVSAGMDQRLDLISDALEDLLHPTAIVLRNDSALRALEGLPETTAVHRGSVDGPVEVTENGLFYTVDLLHGQKTGLFLDQKLNRLRIRRYAKDRTVLDCFSNDGGFTLNAAAAGAREVEGVDISAEATARAAANAQRNGLTQARFTTADVFDDLRNRTQGSVRYGMIVLDPPSFTKSRKTVATALRGYRSINTMALSLLEPGGVLVSASCSHHIDRETFLEMLHESALKARRGIQVAEVCGASPDHPALLSMPETSYLKLAVLIAD
jgi:23S rRNA (cytosine1962-C5)-methyltransferase